MSACTGHSAIRYPRLLDACWASAKPVAIWISNASFDKLGMRILLCAGKTSPHPELVEGRTAAMRRKYSHSVVPTAGEG
jgi:hypothetical protein